ncbi:MAG TPA: YfhO family protein, partial [Dehalococcoidia bacterium]|nr:YfhO family protein [Dehalococcoidia bacterium]
NLLAFLLVRPFSYQAMEGLAVLHYFLAAIFTYVYLRGLEIGRLGSFGGGLAFAFSGFLVAHLGHLNMLESVVWLPLVLYFFHRSFKAGRLAWAVAAGAAYGISILPGHIQITLYLGFFLVLYWLWGLAAEAWTGRRQGRQWPSGSRVAVLPVTILVAFGLAAVQLLPSAELTGLSVRAAISYAKAIEYAVSPLGFITLFIPHFLGPNSTDFWGIQGNLTEVYGYAGMAAMLLAALAVAASRRQAWRWFFALSAIFFLLLSLGQDTVLHGWLYRFVPGFDKVRAPGRFLLFFDFAVALLAGAGLDALTRPLARRDRPAMKGMLWATAALLGIGLVGVLFFLQALLTSQDKDPVIYKRIEVATSGIILAMVFLAVGFAVLLLHRYRGRWRAAIPWLAMGALVADLFSAGWAYNTTTDDILAGFNHPQVVRFLQEDREPYRIDSATNVWDVWQPSTNLNYDIGDVQGLFNPMTLNDFMVYWNGMGPEGRSSRSYDLLNARYVVAHKDVALDWSKYKPVLTEAPKVNVYQNTSAMPRALVVPKAEVLPREAMLERLRAPDFAATETVLLEEGPARNPASTGFARRVVAVSYPTPNHVLVEAETAEPAYLFLADVMYPGWKARVDGHPVPVRRANYLFRAVDLPAGRHTVEFSFEPRTWTIGWVTTAVFLAGIAGVLATAALRKRREG